MLILSRLANERIFIGDNVELVVVSVKGKRVRLGIKAPESMKVVRDELRNTGDDGQNGFEKCLRDVEL